MNTKPGILVLEDNDDVRTILEDLLSSSGYDPIAAEDGRMALKMIESKHPPVGIIDLMLPDMSGLEVIGEINKRYPDIECIVLTAYASQESAIKAVQLGAYNYIQKPYDVEQLLLTIRRALEKHNADEAFRASEEKYRMLFENANDGLVLAELKTGRILDANRAAEHLLGCPRSDISGKPFAQLYPEDHRDHFNKEFARYVKGKQKVDFEAMLISKSNSTIPVYIRTAVMELWGEKAVQIIIRDITERKAAEEALKKRVADVKHISDLMIDSEMRILEIKKEVDTLLGELGRPPRYAE
jgi:PAS domain S-box-containing protein